jgi:hypothetical protein
MRVGKGTKGRNPKSIAMKTEHSEEEGENNGQERHERTIVLMVCACCGKAIAKAQGIKRLIFERGKLMDSVPLRRLLSVSSDGNYCKLKVLCPKRGNEIIEIRARITMKEIAKLEPLGIVQVNRCELVNLRFVQQYMKGSHLMLEYLPKYPFEITDTYAESVDARMKPWRNL